MNVIAAVYSDWGIGYNYTQSIVLPEDRQNFLNKTKDSIVIMGRRTFEEIGRPLLKRKNIILTSDRKFKVAGAVTAHSVDEVLAMISEEDTEKTFVIGGGVVYKQFLPMCLYAFVTRIEVAPQSDTFFPNLNKLPEWSHESKGDIRESGGMQFSYNLYRNNAVAK